MNRFKPRFTRWYSLAVAVFLLAWLVWQVLLS